MMVRCEYHWYDSLWHNKLSHRQDPEQPHPLAGLTVPAWTEQHLTLHY